MRKIVSILFLYVYSSVCLEAQKWSISLESDYHLPLTTQTAPEYFEAAVPVPVGTNFNNTIQLTTIINDFSLAQGFSTGATARYRLNEVISLELGINFLSRNKNLKTEEYGMNLAAMTGWNFWTLNLKPVIVIGKGYGRSAFSSKFGAIVGLASLKKTVTYDERNKAYRFSADLIKGYLFGLEYSYSFNSFLSIAAEAGIDNLFYTPNKAKLTENDFYTNTSIPMPTYIKEIEYQKNIEDMTGFYVYNGNTYYRYTDEPSKRLTETLKMNSFYFGIGLVYKFSLHEEN